jgi:hypothetical protein
MKTRSLLAAAVLAAATTAVPSAAEAAYTITGYAFAPGALTGNIQYTPTNLSLNVGIGRLNLSGTEQGSGDPASFLTYCVDIFHTLHVPATFDILPIATLIPDATKQTRLLTLIGNADALIAHASNKTEATAAVQLATWEIVNENTASYGFATGTFRSSGGNSDGARALALSYLDGITSGAWGTPANGSLKLFYSATSQSQVITAVPEPATWAMMIAGFGLTGAVSRRRKRATTVVYA